MGIENCIIPKAQEFGPWTQSINVRHVLHQLKVYYANIYEIFLNFYHLLETSILFFSEHEAEFFDITKTIYVKTRPFSCNGLN